MMLGAQRGLHRFAIEERGTVAIVFAISLLALAMTVGLAVDYGRAHATKVRLQNALDAAVLAAAKKMMENRESTEAALSKAVKDFFDLDKPTNHFSNIVSIKGVPSGSDGVMAEAVAEVPTTFMQLTGISKLEIYTSAEATFGLGNAEVALVLDTTASMDGSKLGSLKAAAKDLVEVVFEQTGGNGNKVKFSVVPFAQYVNVGMGYRNASWINVPTDYSTTTRSCRMVRPVTSTSNCRMETRTWMNDGVPTPYDVQICDYTYGPEGEECTDNTETFVWRGCVGSRDYPLSTRDSSYSTRIPGLLNEWCPGEILPLTDEQNDVLSAIDAMSASGETYIPSGLVWGWRALSHTEPFAQGANPSGSGVGRVRKFLVLMTDGANTRSPSQIATNVNDHWGSDAAEANRITTELCANIKADNIEIFTIAFDVTDQAIKDILRGCTSTSGAFFDASGSSELAAAFRNIANTLGELRLSR